MQLLSLRPSCNTNICSFSTQVPPYIHLHSCMPLIILIYFQSKNVSSKRQNQIAQIPKEQQLNFLKTVAPPLMAAILAFSPLLHPPVSLGQTIDIQKGANLFRQACIGCHDAGGNIIQPGATLFLKDLQRNGNDTEEEIYRVTYFGKGRMPGFGQNCTPRGQCTFGPRLQEEDIKLLAAFVKLQADQGWPNVETSGD